MRLSSLALCVTLGCGTVSSEPDAGAPCASDPDCGDPTVGGWSACEASDPCAANGERNREIGTPHCVDDRCAVSTSMETEGCARDTEGVSCGADLPGPWSACGYANACIESGQQQRSVDAQVCRSGTCTIETRTETMDCTRETDGDLCDDDNPCSPETHCGGGVCSGFICAPCPC